MSPAPPDFLQGPSFEFFAPRSAVGVEEFLAPKGCLDSFAQLGPALISVSGSAPASLKMLEHVKKAHCIRPQLHLPRAELTEQGALALVESALRIGVQDVLVTGGLPGSMQPASGSGFGSVLDLVRCLKQKFGTQLRVAVSGFPRGTCGEAGSYEADLSQLRQQVDAGAELVLCLPTFDAASHLSFAAEVQRAGIACFVKPGILPLCASSDLRRICRALSLTPPAEVWKQLDGISSELALRQLADASFERMAAELHGGGAAPPHVYTLNSLTALQGLKAAGFVPLKHRIR